MGILQEVLASEEASAPPLLLKESEWAKLICGRMPWMPEVERFEAWYVRLTRIHVDDAYQRNESDTQVRRLAEDFNWPGYMLPICHVRDGGLWCVDGQHRIAAALAGGHEWGAVIVLPKSGQRGEARVCRDRNTRQRNLSPVNELQAKACAGEPEAVELVELIHLCGLHVPPVSQRGVAFRGVRGAERAHAALGRDGLVWVFDQMVAFSRDAERVDTILFDGLVRFRERHPGASPDHISETLNRLNPQSWTRALEAERERQPGRALSKREAAYEVLRNEYTRRYGAL